MLAWTMAVSASASWRSLWYAGHRTTHPSPRALQVDCEPRGFRACLATIRIPLR